MVIMEPGNEMDALIADLVMDIDPLIAHASQVMGQFIEGAWICPKYSIEISAAWEVAEKIHELGLGWMLVLKTEQGKYIAYQATGCADPDYGDWFAHGDTATHAMGLAALKAVGHSF